MNHSYRHIIIIIIIILLLLYEFTRPDDRAFDLVPLKYIDSHNRKYYHFFGLLRVAMLSFVKEVAW